MILSLIVYVADAAIIGTYAALAWLKEGADPYVHLARTRWFHWANAAGGVPTITFEVLAHAWPVLPLTATFCAVGFVGTWRTR